MNKVTVNTEIDNVNIILNRNNKVTADTFPWDTIHNNAMAYSKQIGEESDETAYLSPTYKAFYDGAKWMMANMGEFRPWLNLLENRRAIHKIRFTKSISGDLTKMHVTFPDKQSATKFKDICLLYGIPKGYAAVHKLDIKNTGEDNRRVVSVDIDKPENIIQIKKLLSENFLFSSDELLKLLEKNGTTVYVTKAESIRQQNKLLKK